MTCTCSSSRPLRVAVCDPCKKGGVSPAVKCQKRAEKLTNADAERRAASPAGIYAPRTVQLVVRLILRRLGSKALANATLATLLRCCRRSACTLTTSDITTIHSPCACTSSFTCTGMSSTNTDCIGTSPSACTSVFTCTRISSTNTDGTVGGCDPILRWCCRVCAFVIYKMGLFLFLYRWVIFAMGYFCGSIFKKVYLYRATMRHRSLRHAWRESVRISRVCFYFSIDSTKLFLQEFSLSHPQVALSHINYTRTKNLDSHRLVWRVICLS